MVVKRRRRAGRTRAGRTARRLEDSYTIFPGAGLPGKADGTAEDVNVVVRIVAGQPLNVGGLRLGYHRGVHVRLHRIVIPVGHVVALPGVAELECDLTLQAEAGDEILVDDVLAGKVDALEGGVHIRE